MIYAPPPVAITQVVLKKKFQGWQVCESFRRHVYRKHTDRVLRPDYDDDDDDGNTEVVDEDFDQPRTHTVTENPPCMDELLKFFKENLFKFILKCREKNHLLLSVQEEIADDVNFLLCFF